MHLSCFVFFPILCGCFSFSFFFYELVVSSTSFLYQFPTVSSTSSLSVQLYSLSSYRKELNLSSYHLKLKNSLDLMCSIWKPFHCVFVLIAFVYKQKGILIGSQSVHLLMMKTNLYICWHIIKQFIVKIRVNSEHSLTLMHLTMVQSQVMRLNILHYRKPPQTEFQGWHVPPVHGSYIEASHPSLKIVLS